MLTAEFLAPYYQRGDNFPNLLARCTYRSKYSRNGGTEVWTDTIRRVVESNCDLDPDVTNRERELLFHLFWTMQALPPGRGLWVGGIDNIPADARYNCWYTTVYDINDWGWVANQLMLGGGVGVGLEKIHLLPSVERSDSLLHIACRPDHPNIHEVAPDPFLIPHKRITVSDSREGWVNGLVTTL